MIECDWVRQAVLEGLHREPAKVSLAVDTMLGRAGRMADVFAASPSAGDAEKLARNRIAILQGIRDQAADKDPAESARRWLEARRAMRDVALAHPAIRFDRLLLVTRFAPHTVRNITRTFAWQHKPGGDLCVLSDWRGDGTLRSVLQGQLGAGHVHSLDVHPDADRLVFSFARQPLWPPRDDTTTAAGEGTAAHRLRQEHPPLCLWEIGVDGSGLRGLTDDPFWNDFEPTYAADGTVVFASDRCGRSAECGPREYDIANANLYRLAPGDPVARRVTDSKDMDRDPRCLDDGRLVYTHWEYQERHFMEVHSLWTVRPDGFMADALYKQHMKAPLALRSARPVPGAGKLVAVATGHHTFAHGSVVYVDPSAGSNDVRGLSVVTPGVRPQEGPMAGRTVAGGGVADCGGLYQTPYALSDECLLASYAYPRPHCTAPCGVDSNGFAVYLIDVHGNRELIHRDRLFSCSHPVPLVPRPHPAELPELVDRAESEAVCYVADVYQGMDNVPRGTIKHLRIAQHVGWPLDPQRGMAPYFADRAYQQQFGYWSWSPVRVIGTVGVEEDGSACFTVPAGVGVYFQALDERFMEVRRMRSMVGLQQGEVRGCHGCHESGEETPLARWGARQALGSEPRKPTPPPWGSEKLLGYEWLVQPILDRHCTRCHGADRPDGDIDLSGRRAEDGFVQSFRTMFGRLPDGKKTDRRLVSVADRFSDGSVSRPWQFGSHRSGLITTLRDDPLHRREVRMGQDDWQALVTWVDANAPYFDRFIDKRSPR
ncbi:MAG: hypothetical protein HQ581_28250, partial [Planctomycetes bacterium]|nr:hypothetical protein [Planctomycetota bacterium]